MTPGGFDRTLRQFLRHMATVYAERPDMGTAASNRAYNAWRLGRKELKRLSEHMGETRGMG